MMEILIDQFYNVFLPFLPISLPVIFLGIFISYEDYRTGLIKNQYIIALFFGGVFYHLFTGNMFRIEFEVIKIFLMALLIGFGLYFIGIWPAGDAKLFTVYILFFPPYMYTDQLIMQFALNTFVPVFLVFSTIVFLKSRENFKDALKYSFEPYRLFLLVMVVFGIAGWVMRFLEFLNFRVNFFVAMFILFLAFEIVFTLISLKTEVILVSLVLLRIIFDFEYITSVSYLYETFNLIIIFVFFRFFILYLTFHYYAREVSIDKLEEGMSPAEGIVKEEDGGYHKVSFLKVSLIDFMQDKKRNFIHDILFLKDEDIEKLKSLREEGEMDISSLKVDKTQHFAFLLLIGYILTFLLGTDIFSFFMLII